MKALSQTSAKFDLAFAATANHFRLNKKERAVALLRALEDYRNACRCYYAIARSLRT
jgi:predicted LPLAT superfamily acyltransferase